MVDSGVGEDVGGSQGVVDDVACVRLVIFDVNHGDVPPGLVGKMGEDRVFVAFDVNLDEVVSLQIQRCWVDSWNLNGSTDVDRCDVTAARTVLSVRNKDLALANRVSGFKEFRLDLVGREIPAEDFGVRRMRL